MQQLSKNVNQTTGLREGSFGIGTFEKGDRVFPALIKADGQAIDLSKQFHDTHAIFDDWLRHFDVLVDVAAKRAADLSYAELRPRSPLSHPNILCAGANYKQHSAQMLTNNKFNQHNRLPGELTEDFYKRNYALMEKRSREGTPFLWTSLHSSLAGADDDVVLPVIGEQLDWELEFTVVIGRHARYSSVKNARTLIAGYTILNDLGTVDIFRRTDIPWGYDWISKNQPTFKLLGPVIVPAAFISPESDDMRIGLKVNGKVMHDWPIDDMIFNVDQLVAYASERVNLMPGDVISTGSPPGNGSHHGHFLQPGDVMESAITFLGRQRNTCVAEARPAEPLAFGNWKNLTQ